MPKSANKDLAAQIRGSQTRMIHLERDDLTDDTAAELAKGEPPLQAVFDQVRQLWAITLAPTS